MHASGIEPVCGLVEDQQLGLPEQRASEPEALAHPERVGPHPPVRRPREVDELERLLDALWRDVGFY